MNGSSSLLISYTVPFIQMHGEAFCLRAYVCDFLCTYLLYAVCSFLALYPLLERCGLIEKKVCVCLCDGFI